MYILTSTGDQFKPEGVATDRDLTGLPDEETRNVLFYRSSITGPQGARYELLREKYHTGKDVEDAKKYIRHNFDVVSISILQAK